MNAIIKMRERRLLARLADALTKNDEGDTSTTGEIALARWELQQFYRNLGMHP